VTVSLPPHFSNRSSRCVSIYLNAAFNNCGLINRQKCIWASIFSQPSDGLPRSPKSHEIVPGAPAHTEISEFFQFLGFECCFESSASVAITPPSDRDSHQRGTSDQSNKIDVHDVRPHNRQRNQMLSQTAAKQRPCACRIPSTRRKTRSFDKTKRSV
jgi:hypothetical protein